MLSSRTELYLYAIGGFLALLVLLMYCANVQAQACNSTEDPYECLTPFYGDSHVHAGTVSYWRRQDLGEQAGEIDTGCSHAYRGVPETCAAGAALGADWINISQHSDAYANPEPGWQDWLWYIAQDTPWVEPLPTGQGTGDTIPRNTQGFPLTGGTFTDRELIWNCDQAFQSSTPGSFVCSCGIEFTGSDRLQPTYSGDPANPSALPLESGHKISICHQVPTTMCSDQPGTRDEDYCGSEAEYYRWAQANYCSVALAHPCGNNPADLGLQDGTKLGGVNPSMVRNIELSSGACEVDNGLNVGGEFVETYRYALDTPGYFFGAVGASDTHQRPGGGGDGTGNEWMKDNCAGAQGDAFSSHKTGCWMGELTAGELVGAHNAVRCFWMTGSIPTGSTFPWIRVSARDNDDTTRRVPSGGTVTVIDGNFHLVAEFDPGDHAAFVDRLEVIHNDAIVDTLACAGACSFDRVYDDAAAGGSIAGFWYARAMISSNTRRLVSSPVKVVSN